MIKLLFLALGAWIVYRIFRHYGRIGGRSCAPGQEAGEDMVRCAHCGVHLPRSEAIVSSAKSPEDKSHGEFFCTDEHRRLHRN